MVLFTVCMMGEREKEREGGAGREANLQTLIGYNVIIANHEAILKMISPVSLPSAS